MKNITEAETLNHVVEWLSDNIERETFRLQHVYAIKFIAMGHGWIEFDLHLFDGSMLYMEAWVDRDQSAMTITNRNPVTNETELTFLNVIQL
tara:strand:+ start:115 stop:390 length:276 start_codon:yes stop_codon:yes gene_type:complete